MAELTNQQNALESIWTSICTIAEKSGVVPLNKLPGLWVFEAERWKLSLNAHQEKIGDVSPFTANVEFNGFPAGIISPNDGLIAAGDLANIFTLEEALRAKAEA